MGKNEFIKKLEEVNIMFKKINGNNYYKYSLKELKDISDKNKWVCIYDEQEEVKNDIFDDTAEEKIDQDQLNYYKIKCNNQLRQI